MSPSTDVTGTPAYWVAVMCLIVAGLVAAWTASLFVFSSAPFERFEQLVALALLVMGIGTGMFLMYRRGLDTRRLRAVTGVSIGVGGYGTVVSGLAVVGHVPVGLDHLDWGFVILVGTLGGMLIGIPVGHGYVRLEAANHRARRQIEEMVDLNRQAATLQRVIRHDLRTHTNVITGYLAIVAERADDEQRQALDAALRHAARLEAISEKSRRLRRVWDAHRRQQPRALDAVLDEALTPVAEEFPEANVEIQPPPPCTVLCHPLAHWAIEEAVTNALVHNDPDETAVTIGFVERERSVHVEVRDDGRGIASGEVAPLRNGEETPLEHTSGLGLQLIDWTVREGGGTVDVDIGTDGTVVSLGFLRPDAASEVSG